MRTKPVIATSLFLGLILHALVLLSTVLGQPKIPTAQSPVGSSLFRVETDPARARISVLSWDTEGGDRARMNLLRSGTNIGLRLKVGGQWRAGDGG
jgi:hypothetical protein